MSQKRFMLPRGTDVFLGQIRVIIEGVIAACILCALENTWFSSIKFPFLASSSPSLTLVFVLSVGFMMGDREGAVCGIFTGFLCEGAGESGLYIYPLLYFLCGYLSGLAAEKLLAYNYPSFLIYSLIGCAALSLFEISRLTLVIGELPKDIFFPVILPRVILTMAATFPIYFIMLLYVKLRIRKKKRSDIA